MIQDINLQVYQMRANGYTFIEIADSLDLSDEEIRKIDDINQDHLSELAKLSEGLLQLSDIN